MPFSPRFVGYYLEGIGGNFKIIAPLVLSCRLPIRGMFAVGMVKQSVNFIGQGYLFAILVGYLLREKAKNILVFSVTLQIFHLLAGYQLRDACGSEDENNL